MDSLMISYGLPMDFLRNAKDIPKDFVDFLRVLSYTGAAVAAVVYLPCASNLGSPGSSLKGKLHNPMTLGVSRYRQNN